MGSYQQTNPMLGVVVAQHSRQPVSGTRGVVCSAVRKPAVYLPMLTLLLSCLAVVIRLLTYTPERIVDLRNAWFTEVVGESSAFESAPSVSNGFLRDTSESVAEWNSQLDGLLGASRAAILRSAGPTDAERAKAIVLALWNPQVPILVGCGRYDSLAERVRRIPSEGACCSDYTKVFIAMASALGLSAREVQNSVHGMNEYFDREHGKWVFVDAHLGLFASDGVGQPLSLLEIRGRRFRGETVVFESVCPARENVRDVISQSYDGTDKFGKFVVTAGENVLEVDRFTARLSMLPRPIRHLVLHTVGIRPGYRLLGDTNGRPYVNSHTQHKRRIVTLLFGIVACVGVSLLGFAREVIRARS